MNGHLIVHDWQDNLSSEPDRQSAGQSAGRSSAARTDNVGFGTGLDVNIGATPQTGLPFSESMAMTSATAFACTRARGETLASLPSIVYEQVSRTSRERARGTEPWRLLYDEPNPNIDPVNFYELINIRQFNRGNGFAEIERDGADNPIALWPIHPSRVLARSERDGSRYRLYWDVMTDVKDPSGMGYKLHRVEDRNMLNVCGVGGDVLASGILDVGSEEVSLDIAAQRYGSGYFKKGARPSGVVEYPGYIDDDDQRANFRADMNRLHTGVENWHTIAVMWNGAKWRELQANPQQAQFLETRGFSARQLCRLWNVPPAIVQIFDDYKFNTVDAMIMQFVLTCVRSDAVRIERAISRKVLSYRDERGRLRAAFNDREYFLEFLLEGLLRGDAKKQAETLEIKRRNGVINGNEWRALDNLNPIGPQGDKYVLPGGFGDLATLGTVAASKPASSGGGSDNASAASASDIGFDRGQVIQAVDRAIGPRRNQVRGSRVQSKRRELIATMATNQLAEALDRINAVLDTDRARQSAKGLDLSQVHWNRHQARLEKAFLPGCQSYSLSSKRIDANAMCTWLADAVTAFQFDGQVVDLTSLAARAAKEAIQSKGDSNEA